MRYWFAVFAVTAILLPLYAQDWISRHREDETKWAKKAGLSQLAVHRMWRSTSHFADEQDDDSHIELLDARVLAGRNQVLLVTSAGDPRCLNLTVFSKATGSLKLWSADSTPAGHGFCDKLGLPARFVVTERGIEVVVPLDRLNHSPRAIHADVEHWTYHWTGVTYLAGQKEMRLEYIPE